MPGRSGLTHSNVIIGILISAEEAKSLLLPPHEARPPTAYVQLDEPKQDGEIPLDIVLSKKIKRSLGKLPILQQPVVRSPAPLYLPLFCNGSTYLRYAKTILVH